MKFSFIALAISLTLVASVAQAGAKKDQRNPSSSKKAVLFCEATSDLANEEYTVTISPYDSSYMGSQISIEFSGYRIGSMFYGSYSKDKEISFAAVAGGSLDTSIVGTISNLDSKPVLKVTKGPEFVGTQNRDIACKKK